MALDKLVDSAALDASLDYTAGVIKAILLHLAGMDGQTVPALPYDLAGGTGFGAAILAFTNAHPIFDGSASPADIGNIFAGARAGSFTLAADRDTAYSVTHDLGETPDMIFFWTDDGTIADPNVIEKHYMSAGGLWLRGSQDSPAGSFGWRMRPGSTALAQPGAGIAGSGSTPAATETTFRIAGASTWVLAGGVTYYWVAAVLRGGA